MPIDYDSYSRLPPLLNGKARSQSQTFITTQPFSGPIFTQLISDDTPVTWGCSVTCSSLDQSQAFDSFLQIKDDNGTRVLDGGIFTKSIKTEWGFVDHEVFMSVTPTEPSQNGDTFTYSFTLYAEMLLQPDAMLCNPSLFVLYGDTCSKIAIDTAINSLWPEA